MKIIFNYSKKILANPLFAGSLIMFIGTNVHNVGQLLYHYLAINLLSKAHYGDLAALVSIFGLLAVIQQSLALAIVKFIASSKDENEADNLTKWVFLWSLYIAGTLIVIIYILAPFLTNFLHIAQSSAVYLFAPIVAIAFVSNTIRALLQGFMRFTHLSVSLIIEVSFKILFTALLLYLGYKLVGAIIGLFIGVFIGFMAVVFPLKDKLIGKRKPISNKGSMFKYSLPVLAQSLAVTSMMSSDILLVKHFFQPDTAGAYAALAKFGAIALFAASPITQVTYPLIAKRYSRGEKYHHVFYMSLLAILSISALIVLVYFFFGSTIASLLTAGKYVQESYLLWWLGVYMLLMGVAVLFTQFYLSIGKTWVVGLFVLAALLQIVLIVLFHSALLTIVQVSIISATLLVSCLSIYFPYHHKNE